MRSTRPPCLAMLSAWYCIRGDLPTSPSTKIWTDMRVSFSFLNTEGVTTRNRTSNRKTASPNRGKAIAASSSSKRAAMVCGTNAEANLRGADMATIEAHLRGRERSAQRVKIQIATVVEPEVY